MGKSEEGEREAAETGCWPQRQLSSRRTRRTGEERRNATRSIDGFYAFVELASENKKESFGTLEHLGGIRKKKEKTTSSLLFLLYPCFIVALSSGFSSLLLAVSKTVNQHRG